MVDISAVMTRTEKLARESGIALFPHDNRAYARLNETTDCVEWVIFSSAPIGIKSTPQILDHDRAEQILMKRAQGFLFD